MSNWNQRFTDLIRESRPYLWGNWALNQQIRVGAIGFVDSRTGAFKYIGQLTDARVIDKASDRRWKLSSIGVSRQNGELSASASVIDPGTGLMAKPESTVTWKFDREDSLVSEFNVVAESHLEELTVLKDEFDTLYKLAAKASYGHAGGIAQGFGVVTSVIHAASGVNAASAKKGAEFTLAGSVDGLNALLGDQGPAGKASIKSTRVASADSIDHQLWPAAKDSLNVNAANAPIAFGFSSFDGQLLLPVWTGLISNLQIVIDSKARSFTTYTVKFQLSYESSNGQTTEQGTIIGGSSHSISNLPLDATNIQLTLNFIGVLNDVSHQKRWSSPLTQWRNGIKRIDITGTWPGETQVIDLDENPPR